MPLVTIDLLEGRSREALDAISDAVHAAMVSTLGVPERDRFQVLTEHRPDTLRFDRSYLDVRRSDAFVLVRITLALGRTTAAKQELYRELASRLGEAVGLGGEDLMVTLVENSREDWSFGHGRASYLELPPEAWR